MDYGQMLLARRKEIEEVIQKKREIMQIPLTESIDELSLYDQHPGDIGSEVYEREKDAGLLELYELELEKLDDALDRYQKGQYGICEVCGKPIEEGRLTRLINTTLCAQCAHYNVKEKVRTEEYNLISAGQMADEGETFQVAGYEYFENGDGSSTG
ncbi:MAG: TraR/DksA C4-type zinc finger protein [Syntrophomonadaceae bacterium]|jgi:DnaK suppressor protein